MDTQLTKENIIQIYNDGNAVTKQILIEKFGKAFFSNDWMKLWEKFCSENKLTLTLPYVSPSTSDEEYIDAQFMMMHIIRLKRKKKPDWNNSSEYKYVPYFDMRSKSGFAFSFSFSVFWYSITAVGSRLCIPDDDKLASELAVEFLPIYEKIMVE